MLIFSVPIWPIGNKETYEDDLIPREHYQKVHGHFDHCRSCGLDYGNRFKSNWCNVQMFSVDKDIAHNIVYRKGLSIHHCWWVCANK